MKQILRIVTLLSVLMLAASAVFAQSERRTIVNIPFAFQVGDKTLPAGEYRIKPNRRVSDQVWLIQTIDHRAGTFVMTGAIRSDSAPRESRLVFHRYGDQYFLAQVWTQGINTGIELPISRQERAVEVAAAAGERQIYVLTVRAE